MRDKTIVDSHAAVSHIRECVDYKSIQDIIVDATKQQFPGTKTTYKVKPNKNQNSSSKSCDNKS